MAALPSAGDVYAEYPDPRRDEWTTKTLPKLKALAIRERMRRSGLSRRAVQMIRTGRRPNPNNLTKLRAAIHVEEGEADSRS